MKVHRRVCCVIIIIVVIVAKFIHWRYSINQIHSILHNTASKRDTRISGEGEDEEEEEEKERAARKAIRKATRASSITIDSIQKMKSLE